MEKRNLVCISCPLGCQIEACIENGEVVGVSGNTCPRGAEYAKKELTAPTRIVTGSVKVINGTSAVVSVKTKTDIPKDKIWECIKILKETEVKAPVYIGDIVCRNVADTGVDAVATKNVLRK